MLSKKTLVPMLLVLIGCASGKYTELTGVFDVIESVSFPMSALSDQDVAAYVGKQVIIKNGQAVFNGDTCLITKIKSDTVSTEECLGQVRTEIEKKIQTKLPSTIIGMSLYCNGKFWEKFPNYFFCVNANIYLSVSEGVVFILKRNSR